MALKDLDIDVTYETNENIQHLVDTFYIPVLSESNKYYRVAGFFSSTSLIIAAEGIEALIHNNGKMYLLISPELSQDDYEVIKKHVSLPDSLSIFEKFQISDDSDDHIKALAYLLDSGKLEIKIAIPKRGETSLFHEKFGLFFDKTSDDILSFSGSINETAKAWLYNIEEFKVFRSWEPGQAIYLEADLKKFIDYWKGNRKQIADVYNLPDSIKNRILSVTPKDIRDLNIMKRYRKDKSNSLVHFEPFPHQSEAIDMWIQNGFSLLMEMATGTGKTRTALGCVVAKLKENEKLLIIVATPQNTLSRQWKEDCKNICVKFDKSVIVDGTNHKWKKDLQLLLLDLKDNIIKNAIIYTTHDTSSSPDFIRIIRELKQETRVLFICDEVHAIATKTQKYALLEEYEYRIGLSATPERMYDEIGTGIIRSYFGNKSYEFTIEKALHTINPATGKPFLNRYSYHPIFVSLNEKEIDAYKKKTKQIIIEQNKDEPSPDIIERLLESRANITKNAENKFDELLKWVRQRGVNSIYDTILFVSDKQIEKCMGLLATEKVTRAKITEKESASKKIGSTNETERQKYIREFSEHKQQMLLAMKCLDEGIDIPNARVALLMSNGTNPREYIQRIGRVIRQAPGKKASEIYDFIVYDSEYPSILEKEAKRANYIAKNAINFNDVRKEFERYGVELNAD